MAVEQKATLRFGVVDKASAAIQQIKGRVSGLTSPIDRVKGVMDKLGKSRAFQEAGKTADLMRSRVETLQGAMVRLTAITGAIAGVGLLAKTTADAAQEIGGFASRYQVSAESIQVYASLISSAGGTADNVAAAMGALGEAMADAFDGDEDATKAFEAIGIGIDDLRSLSREQILEKMANAFSKSENAIAKQAITLKLMGEDGTYFMETLNKGSDEYAKRLSEMREDGGIVSDDEIEKSKEFNDAFGRLTQTIGSIKTDFGLKAVEKLLPLVNRLRELIQANRATIDKIIDQVVEKLPGFISQFGQVAAEAFTMFGKVLSVVGSIIDVIGTGPAAAIALAVAFGPSIMAVAQIGVQIGKVIAMAVTGVGAIPAALITAGAAMVVALVKNWDEVCAYVTGSWERVKKGFSKGIFNGLMTFFDELTTGLLNAVLGTIRSTLESFGLGKFLPDWMMHGEGFKPAAVVSKEEGGAKLAHAQTQQISAAKAEQKVNSSLHIQIDAPKGLSAQVSDIQSDGQVDVTHARVGQAFTGDLYAY